ncbi:MAG: sodium:solute symporter [Flavobacteriales bacterium]|nr:sodium:solute symporter [Flavobacteriales bacterium]|tara:strand:+ start:5401 stop:6807 length:1407 start_codon:yes stop_codon:yes gene_type:complete
MTPTFILSIISAYFLVLILISYLSGKSDSNEAFFLGNKQSPWYVVAFGMIGATLSGVTFISVPGWVGDSQFSYLQMVIGMTAGYVVIANILLPLYYKLNLTSIYGYLEQRFGSVSYRTGSFFFLLSRTIGASFRLYLVANVLQLAIFDAWNVPFWLTVSLTILLIWLYTFRSGIKTIIWTDTLQTLFMLLAVGVSIWLMSDHMQLGLGDLVNTIKSSDYSQIFFWEGKQNFLKQFFSGMFIAIVMTGLDQDMMQKNLSCPSLADSKKNMYWFSVALILVNIFFLALGAMLYIFAEQQGLSIDKGDDLFPIVALQGGLGLGVGVFFILGLIAAAYSSADSALTSLTTAFCVDFLNIENKLIKQQINQRKWVHIAFSILLVFAILIFKAINDESVIAALFKVAGYTYGPLLGLYAFGLFTKWKVHDKMVPLVAITSPAICYVLQLYIPFGFELLIVNGAITFAGLYLLKR